MLIEIFVALPVLLCWYFHISLLPFAVVMLLSLALAFWPPRALLAWAEQQVQGRVRFRYPELVAQHTAKKGDDDGGRVPVFLTVDDAPTAYTHHILEALDECGQGQALFFVIGDYAQANPQALTRIAAARRHAIGNHDARNRLTAAPWRSASDMLQGLKSCAQTVSDLLRGSGWQLPSDGMRYFRPGSGLYTSKLLSVVSGPQSELQYQTLLGDCYAHDCQLVWWPSFLTWFYPRRVAPGSIVILHDGTEQRAKNAAAVIRAMYHQANVRFVALPLASSPTPLQHADN